MTINIIDQEKVPVTLNDIYNSWYGIKTKYTNAIVLLRSGDKYYSFERDAQVITGVMQIEPLPLWKERHLCILPYYSTDEFLSKMVKRGYRAAICEPLSFFNLYQ